MQADFEATSMDLALVKRVQFGPHFAANIRATAATVFHFSETRKSNLFTMHFGDIQYDTINALQDYISASFL